MKDQVFSISRIEKFANCPLNFKFHYLSGIPEFTTPELQIGTAVHKAIEIYCKQSINGQKKRSIEDIVVEAANIVSNSDILNQINEMFKTFVLTHDFNGRKVLAVEEDITQDIGKYKFRGRLDLVEIDGETAVITDWKTGRRIFNKTECDNSLQASAYALLFHKEYPNLRTFRCKFDFVRHSQIIETTRTLSNIRLTESYLERKMNTISEAVKKEDFPPKPSHFCEWCSYANRCPIEVEVSTPEELAARVLVLESVLKDNKTRLKTLVEKHGAVAINDEVFDFYASESETYPADKFAKTLVEHKIDPFRFLKVDSKRLERLNPEILEKLLPLAESKIYTRFGYKNRRPE